LSAATPTCKSENYRRNIESTNIALRNAAGLFCFFTDFEVSFVKRGAVAKEEEEEEEENLFAKKAGCQKGLQPIDAGYHTHNKTKIDQLYTNITC